LRVLVEETLGIQSNAGPHLPHLARFCTALGVDDVEETTPNATTQDAIEWWITVAGERSWLEGWGTWAFSNRRAAFGRVYAALKSNYGLTEEDLFFWKLHAAPAATPEEHRREWAAMGKYLDSSTVQAQVRAASLDMGQRWMAFWQDAVS
jgi:pyrroloquinoline quinone (PQQ) biosynthesis protein C